MSFLKDFDTIFNAFLTDWQNQFPEADVSQGSLIFLKSACLASAVWGLYRYQEWISKQSFPDTADTAALDHWTWIWGLTRSADESDADLLERLLSRIQYPPAGGNAQDYITWAKEADANVDSAYCFPLTQGLGTVDVLILCEEITGEADATEANKLHDADAAFTANMVGAVVKNTTQDTQTTVSAYVDSGELTLTDDIFASGQAYAIQEIPDQNLIDDVQDYIDGLRPVTAVVSVQAPTILSQAVTMTVTGGADILTQIVAEITSYLNGFEPGQKLYVSQLVAIAIQNGADDASVSTPGGDVTPTGYQIIRAGTVSVS